MGRGRIVAIAPVFFVLLWSTGFVTAREGVQYADPLTLAAMRFAIACALLVAIAAAMGARRPTRREALHSGAVGLLLQAVYVGGVFTAIDHRLAAGITALIVGLQPLLSACVVGPLLKERVAPLQWLGLVIGLGGVALVVARKVHFDSGTTTGLGLAFAALIGFTAGTLYQRRFCRGIDLRTGTACQYATAAIALLGLAVAFEPMHVEWSWQLVASLAWMSSIVSVAAILGLLWLIRRMEVARVAGLFYLVPPFTALLAWPWFGETMSWAMAGGMALAAGGVVLLQKGARS
jgi:drug/metabolite transporter (DMT)-like permease